MDIGSGSHAYFLLPTILILTSPAMYAWWRTVIPFVTQGPLLLVLYYVHCISFLPHQSVRPSLSIPVYIPVILVDLLQLACVTV